MSIYDISTVHTTGGITHPFLQGIDLIGNVKDDGEFTLYGCKSEDESRFYNAILTMDKADPVFGWQTVAEVERAWLAGLDGTLLCIESGCFEILETVNVKPEATNAK